MDAIEVIEARDEETFTSVGEEKLETLIELAQPYLPEAREDLEGLRNQGIAFLVLHWVTKGDRGGASGAISQEKEGELSSSYSVPKSGGQSEDFSTTTWGVEFMGIRDKLAVAPDECEEDEEETVG
jgi:hypothetical protein